MKCKQAAEYIVSRQYGENEKEIKDHIADCPRCREISEALERIHKINNESRPWMPDEIYWNTLLYRIHSRVDLKKETLLPSWLYRSIAPAAAAALIVILSLSLIKYTGDNRDIFPTGLSDSELAEFIEEATILNPYITNGTGTTDVLGSEDATVIRDILRDERHVALYYETSAGSLIETINNDEADKLFALMSDDLGNNK
jgi:hypothetical protein